MYKKVIINLGVLLRDVKFVFLIRVRNLLNAVESRNYAYLDAIMSDIGPTYSTPKEI